jgi:hypothetical protein
MTVASPDCSHCFGSANCMMGNQSTAYLLLLPESKQTNPGNLDDLEPDTGNITLGLATTTETRDQHLIVLVDEVQATIVLIRKLR